MRLIVNANVAGVGRRGEIVEADPVLWAELIEADLLTPVDEDGERIVYLKPPIEPVE